MATGIDEDEKVRLAAFPRRNRETGNAEEIRVECGDWNGRMLTHLRVWYQGGRPSGDDDGWRPSKVGMTIREHEIDAMIEALERARAMVRDQGRSTGDSRPAGQPRREPARTPQRPRGQRLPFGDDRPAGRPTRARATPGRLPWEDRGESGDNFSEF